ncbi:hypothetical protein [Novosphingobium album (ex Hu et al. 2023)]|uniref:Glycosyltransferase RgtA/B/C/D-like domain-containing protein n=1 Tax=Novosphingobium album (ex Hu et al. 2023) TaxID=2930093 RepID=A0ABT0B5P3_9SPHN|nr:hypothetical protein [Novosphingobium album (ex Hu et al. 2023)]MCJ2180356.1 hypothetical protein [Novosphingobium album (ex Hu et al. 2023)]
MPVSSGCRQPTVSFGPLPFAVLLLAAFVLRASTFGDPNVGGDETFYQTVGIAMHHGAVPYVDVWDRKPWGLFFLYYLITGISTKPIAYQLVATAFAATTAFVIGRIALLWTNRQGAVLAGLTYLVFLTPFQGYGGQSPVFYNLFIALAVLLALRATPTLRKGLVPASSHLAMLLAGIAITIKTTAFFEAAFVGLWCSSVLLGSPRSRRPPGLTVAVWALTGAAPFLLIAAIYALAGDWAVYWNAMITSNFAKTTNWPSSAIRFAIMFSRLAPLLVVAVLALPEMPDRSRRFMLLWLLAAFIGVASTPHFFMHYALPFLVPLSVASAAFLGRKWIGPFALAAISWLALSGSQVLDFAHARRSRAAFAELSQAIRTHDDGGPLFVFDGPHQLYTMTGTAFPTPLVFTAHLGDLKEKDVSTLSTLGEVKRVLAMRPSTIIAAPRPRQGPPNLETDNIVRAYFHAHCKLVARVSAPDWLNENTVDVWANCRKPPAPGARKP